MLKILKEKWNTNEPRLKTEIAKLNKRTLMSWKYIDVVRIAFRYIYQDMEWTDHNLNLSKITEIDNTNYSGTLLYLIPFDGIDPGEWEYLMTYVGHGSCSGCDTLQQIQNYDWDYDEINDEIIELEQQKDLLGLCRDIIVNTIKPYNDGWRRNRDFDIVEE